jgi:hypothetical protein
MSSKKIKKKPAVAKKRVKKKPAAVKQLEPNIPQLMHVLNQLVEINGRLKVVNDQMVVTTSEILVRFDKRLAELEVEAFGNPQAETLGAISAPDMKMSPEEKEAFAEAQRYALQAIGMNKATKAAGVDTAAKAFIPRNIPISDKDSRITGDGLSMVPKKHDLPQS